MLTRKQKKCTVILFPCQHYEEQQNLLDLFIPKSENAHQNINKQKSSRRHYKSDRSVKQ